MLFRVQNIFGGAFPVSVFAWLLCASLNVFADAAVTDNISKNISPIISPDTLELPLAGTQGRRVDSGIANVNRIDNDALQRFASLEDAVNSLPGFHVREEGGLGGYSELSFRGSDAAAVEIYIDGLRLNQEGEESPDLAKWPLLWFNSVEARSGFDEFGSGGVGSLARLDLSTNSDDQSSADQISQSRLLSGADLRGRIGSFSTAEGAASVYGGRDWRWTIGVEGQTAKNDYPFFSDNGTYYVTSDDAWLRMHNNAYWSRGARASLQHRSEFFKQTLSALWIDYNKEYPGIPNTTSNNSQAYTRRGEWMGAYRIEAYPGRSVIEAGVQAHYFDDTYRDPNQSLGYASYEEAREGTSIEADARAKIPLPERMDLSAQTQFSHEEIEPTITPYDQAEPFPTATRNEMQLGMTLQKKRFDSLSLSAEARGAGVFFSAKNVQRYSIDSLHTVSHDLLPLAVRAGTQWKTIMGSFEALGRYEERSPTSEEFLGDNHGVLPDLNLNPQKTWTASFMHEWKNRIFQFQTTAFWHRYNDPIRLEQNGASPFLHYANGADYRATGIEADDRVDAPHVEARGSLTLQSLRILEGTSEGNWPAYQSPIEGHAEIFGKVQTSKNPFSKNQNEETEILAGPTIDVSGPYYNGDINSIPGTHRSGDVEPGAHLSVRHRHVNLAFDARNLLNRNYQDFAYSVRSGRSYSLGLSINI